MVIERQNKSIVITPSPAINMAAVQKVIDYINVLEIAAKSQGTDDQATDLASSIDATWWSENKHRFLR